MMRILSCLILCLAASLTSWSQAQVDGVQPSAINGLTVASGSALNGITLTAPGGGSPIVQSKATIPGGSTTLVLNSSETAGNILVVGMYGGVTAYTDTLNFSGSLGETGTVMGQGGLAGDGDAMSIACAVIPSSGTDTLTFKANGSTATTFAVVYEVASGSATCVNDVAAVTSNTTSATACSSSAMTTTTANDFLVGICGTSGATSSPMTAGSGWSGGTNVQNFSLSEYSMMSEYRVAATAGSYTATSGTIPSEEQATILVALKP